MTIATLTTSLTNSLGSANRPSTAAHRSWDDCYDQLRLSYEPTYRVEQRRPSLNEAGQPILLAAWVNGRPTIMPPVDLVSVILYDESRQALLTYLISQAQLCGLLRERAVTESFPTSFIQLEQLDEASRQLIASQARFMSETPLQLN
ncbi:MAG TPA: hypothetical protein VLI05_03095 [Candidatus Saccharimonadia bacterium]|nr:hypothetical protein [Candidatus Saccharimonadia bacterium]